MKRLTNFAVLALFAGFAAYGCTESGPPMGPTDVQTFTPQFHTAQIPFETPLIADGGDPTTAIDVGNVLVWNDGSNLHVKYEIEAADWYMSETHLAVATSLGGITQKNGNPIPGKFPYANAHDPWVTEFEYEIPLADFSASAGDELVIAAHAVVWETSSTATVTGVSDASVLVTAFNGVAVGPNPAVAAYEPVGYQDCGLYMLSPASNSVWDTQNGRAVANDVSTDPFFGALWIWRTNNPTYPNSGEYVEFQKTVTLPGPPAGSGSIKITADNGYQVYLNGILLGSAQIGAAFPGSLWENGVTTSGWNSPETWALPFVAGDNTLTIVAANEYAWPTDPPNIQTTGIGGTAGGVCPNPGALIFKLSASYYDRSETAWGGPLEFDGKNWAMYFTYTVQPPPLSGYGVVTSGPTLNYADGGWAGWSVPTNKIVTGGGFVLTGGPAAVSAPGTPGSAWPHYTFGAGEYGWVVRDDPDGASSPGSAVYAVYADMPSGYEIVTSSSLAFSDGGYGGWSCPAGKVVIGGGFQANDAVAVSAPGTPGSVWPHYTFGAGEYGWVVRDAQNSASNTITVYAICASPLSGYEVVNSVPLNYSDGGWAGWSCPAGKVVTGGGFKLTGGPAAVSAPGTPGSAWPHYTFGAGEYGWVVQDDPDGASSSGSTVYAVCAEI